MPPTVALSDVTPVVDVFRRSALPARARLVSDLTTGRSVALRVDTAHPGEPLDGATMMRALHLLAVHEISPAAPVVFDAAASSLSRLLDARRASEHPLVASIDARDLLKRPAETLRAVEAARQQGWEIGLHEVGASAATLAAVQLVQPSLVSLAQGVLDDPVSPIAIETLATAAAFSHGTGATVAADRLDTGVRLANAMALGATLGSGTAVRTRASEVPADLDYTLDLFVGSLLPDHRRSPYQLAASRYEPRLATKPLLVSLSRHLERLAQTTGPSTMLLSAFQHAGQVTADTRRRYQGLVPSTELVVLMGRGLASSPIAGAVGADLGRRDALVDEWLVLVLSSTTAALLVAEDQHKRVASEAEREFRYVLTYDRDLVAHAARSMLTRLEHR